MRDWRLSARPAMVALMMTALLGSALVATTVSVEAAPKKPTVQASASVSGRVSRKQALATVAGYRAMVNNRLKAMTALYDYHPSMTTLGNAFDRGGVNTTIKERYLSAWAQNGLYLTWDVVKAFYIYHLQQLDKTAETLASKPSVTQADMAYLSEGMKAWETTEREVARRFNDKVTIDVREAALLQAIEGVQRERDQVNKELMAFPGSQYIQAKAQRAPQLASIDQREANLKNENSQWGERAKATDSWLRDVGYKTRLFTALYAPTTRIVVARAIPSPMPTTYIGMNTEPRPMTLVSTNRLSETASASPATIRNRTTVWDTNWGQMTLTVKGNKVTGFYPHDKGKITGVLSPDGRTISAWWSEYPSYKGPNDAGKAVFNINPQATQLSGQWGYGNSLNQGNWTGTRQK